MQLARFLNKLFKTGGFVLIDANLKKYIIGSPEKDKPITLKLLDKKLHYKLLFFPDLYLGEAYADGTLKIENGDLLLSYCGTTLSGVRSWMGRTVDVPVMGVDDGDISGGYCTSGDTPNFKLYKTESRSLIELTADIPQWHSNGIHLIAQLKEAEPIPEDFQLMAAYPNPFNPVTQIGYEVPVSSNIEISIYDIRGQKVISLKNGIDKPGKHSVTWNADQFASGVYFIHFTASGNGIQSVHSIQKLMLVK